MSDPATYLSHFLIFLIFFFKRSYVSYLWCPLGRSYPKRGDSVFVESRLHRLTRGSCSDMFPSFILFYFYYLTLTQLEIREIDRYGDNIIWGTAAAGGQKWDARNRSPFKTLGRWQRENARTILDILLEGDLRRRHRFSIIVLTPVRPTDNLRVECVCELRSSSFRFVLTFRIEIVSQCATRCGSGEWLADQIEIKMLKRAHLTDFR